MTVNQLPPHPEVHPSVQSETASVRAVHRRQLLWLAGGITLVSGCMLALALSFLRTQTIETSEHLTRSFAQVIEEQTTRTFQSVDQTLQLTANNLDHMRLKGTLTNTSALLLFHQTLTPMPFARALWVTDAQGRLIYNSGVEDMGFDLSNAAYFKVLSAQPQTGFLISTPIKSKIDNQWLIPVSRPLIAADGAFIGTIAASVNPLYFGTLWTSIDLGADGLVALLHRNGSLMMRSPFDEPSMHKNFSGERLLRDLLLKNASGDFANISPVDGVSRMFSYRTLAEQRELVVVVGQSYERALKPWRQLTWLALTLWIVAATGIVLLCLFLSRAWQQKANLQARSEQLAERLRLATDAADIGVWDWDISRADQWYASPTYFTMLGYDPGNGLTIRQQWIDRLHPEDKLGVEERMQAVLAGGSLPYQYEARMLHANGSYRWISVVGRVLARDKDGRAIRMMGVRLDITEHRQAQAAILQSETRYRALFEYAPDGILISDTLSNQLDANPSICRMLGYTREELIGLHTSDFVTLAEVPQIDVGLAEISRQSGYHREWQFRRKDGSVFSADVIATQMPDGNLMGMIRDVTERKRTQDALRESAAHMQAIQDNMVDGVVTINSQGRVETFNVAASNIFGYTPDEILGHNASILIEDADQHRVEDDLHHRLSADGADMASFSREAQGKRKDGSLFPIHLSLSRISRNDQTTVVGIVRDITQQRHDENEIRRLAFHDALTGLPNRRLLMDRLQQAMVASARTGKHGALMFLDLDHFKQLNDTQGHDVGDLLLQQVAQRLQACVRDGDSVARLGGDEFVVLLEALSPQRHAAATQAEAITSKLLEAFEAPYNLNGFMHEGTTSIGIVVFMGGLDSMDNLLKKADLAMYQGKSAGRNTARFYDPSMQAAVAEHDAHEKDLRRGMAMQEFVLHYQIQVDGEGRTLGVEALVRWNHGHKGMVAPEKFIALAEQTGLILALGQDLLHTACQQLATWAGHSDRKLWTMAINVSASQFAQAGFVAKVSSALEQSNANPQLLKLELTESILVHDMEDVIVKMSALKDMGVGFSLDDFGTGYSSLSYLKRLPLDQLKIDQSFVRDVLTDPSDAVIVRTIIALGHSLGLTVMAEGVETEGQLAFLRAAGCDAFQGFYFGYPDPAEALG